MARRIGLLPNLGPVMERDLGLIDVHDEDALRAMGAPAAYARLRFVHGRRIGLNALYAMDAALQGIDWRAVTPERKAELRAATARPGSR